MVHSLARRLPTPALSVPEQDQPVSSLTTSQRRVLRALLPGDLIWEIAEDPRYCTVYDEKRGAARRLTRATVNSLEQQGWIQRQPNPPADRLDSWELTPLGRTMATGSTGRSRA